MSITRDDKLALRRQSVRTLTAGQLSIAHGGQVNCTGSPTTTRTTGTGLPPTKTKTK